MGSNARSNATATRDRPQQGIVIKNSFRRQAEEVPPPRKKLTLDLASYLPSNFGRRGVEVIQVPANAMDDASAPSQTASHGESMPSQVPDAVKKEESHAIEEPKREEMSRQQEEQQMIDPVESVSDSPRKEESNPIEEPGEMSRQQEGPQTMYPVEAVSDSPKEESNPIDQMPQAPYSNPSAAYPPSYPAYYPMAPQQQQYGVNAQIGMPVYRAQPQQAVYAIPHGGGYFTQQVDQTPQAPYSNPSAAYPPSYAAYNAMASQQQQYGVNAQVGMPLYRAQPQQAVYAIPHGGGYFTQQLDQMQGFVPSSLAYANPQRGGPRNAPPGLSMPPPGINPTTTMMQGTQQPQYQYPPGSGGGGGLSYP